MMALSLAAVTAIGLVGCGSTDEAEGTDNIKVGLVTNGGALEDKSFNQGSWEGVQKAAEEFNLNTKYLVPGGTTEADFLKEISNLYDAGFRVIVTPGFRFETAIQKAQTTYPDAKFILIDGQPTTADGTADIKENTVGIFYAEHEAGFLAGVATAIQLKDGDVGFIGGAKIPPVQRFNWGFQQGLAYANEHYGTKVSAKAENFVYEGGFENASAGQQLAAAMYDRGVKAIFQAAGSVGVGVITEATARAKQGKEAYVIGADVDQFTDGIYDGEKSVVLTSALKEISTSVYDMIKTAVEGTFEGGKALTFNATVDGVGLPKENPNLSEETMKTVTEVYEKLKAGEITVSAEQGSLLD